MLISLTLLRLVDRPRREPVEEVEYEDRIDGVRRRFLALVGDAPSGSVGGGHFEERRGA